MPLPAALAHAGSAVLGGLLLLVLALALFAVVDVPLQRHLLAQHAEDEPPGDEAGAQGGRGQRRGQGADQRARMREMANRRMLAAVPSADLVVMNPTHYAVALKYDEGTMGAPRVVAKGADLLALRIRDVAKAPRCRCCRRRRWRARCTPTPRSTARSRPRCSPPWRRCWPTCTSCAPRLAGPRRRCRPTLPELPVPPELDPHARAAPPEAAA